MTGIFFYISLLLNTNTILSGKFTFPWKIPCYCHVGLYLEQHFYLNNVFDMLIKLLKLWYDQFFLTAKTASTNKEGKQTENTRNFHRPYFVNLIHILENVEVSNKIILQGGVIKSRLSFDT